MDRYGYSRPPTYARVSTAAPSFLNPAVSIPGFPGAGYAGEANILNPNLRPGMPGWAGNAAPPTPPASFTDTSITSGDWTLPRSPTGQSQLGRDIAARVQGAVGGNRTGFGGVATPGRPTPPNVPDAFDLGNSIRSRVQARQGGFGSPASLFPTQGQTGRAQPPPLPGSSNLPSSDLGNQIRSRGSAGGQGQWGAPQPPAMPSLRPPTQPGLGRAAASPPTPPTSGVGAPGLTGQGMAPDQGYTPAPTTPTAPGPAPAPSSGGTLGAPQGQVPIGNITGGGDWGALNVYDSTFAAEGARHGVDPAMLKAMSVVESGGVVDAQGVGGAMGLMQIKPDIWGGEAAALGYDLNTPEGQIGFAAALLGGSVPGVAGNTPEERFLSTYYPTPCLDCAGESGHTPRMYLDDIAMYTDQINGAAPGGGMAPAPVDPTMAGVGAPGLTGAPGEIVQQADGSVTDGVTTIPPAGGGQGGVVTQSPPPQENGNEAGAAIIDAAILAADENWSYEPTTAAGWQSGEATDDPYGGLDCSAFIRYLDQKYAGGSGNVPVGSHYQYSAATGDTNNDGVADATPYIKNDFSQLQPGDVIYADTGADTGSMDNGNIRSDGSRNPGTHVAIYTGPVDINDDGIIDGDVIHSSAPGVGVVTGWASDYESIYLGHSSPWG
ncbi:MAG: transglycosylase SLT domain-containing protein [Chloroflexota bacterium]|nr:transglycosylase SLT domain-containing protein [Chloroflexota bacterium]